MDKKKRLKLLILGAAGVVTAVLVVITMISARHAAMGHLTITAAPAKMTLKIDNIAAKTKGEMYISPGDHKWEATFANFTSKKGSFSIKKGEEQSLDIYLEPANDAGKQYLTDHPEEASAIEGLVGKEFDKKNEQAVEKTPLINELPYIEAGFEFRVDYGTDSSVDPPKTTIYIESISDEATQNALNWIRQQGTDPSTLTIVYSHREPDNYNIGHQ